MPAFPLVPQSEQDSDNRSANTARMVNCYIEPNGSEVVIKSVLGTVAFASLAGAFPRAVAEIGDAIFIAQGGRLYEISVSGTIQDRGVIVDSLETTISGNDSNVTVVAGGRYFVWDGTTLSEPTTGAFSSFGSVSYFGSLTVLTELNGSRVQWSDVFDPTTLGGLSFATADAYDDKILRGISVSGAFWIMKETSLERWYQNGADLAPVAGGSRQIGLKAYNLVGLLPDGAFFVSSDGHVRLLSSSFQIISNRAVETAIEQGDATHCFYYQDEGHGFCVVRFSDRPSWVFDLATGLWHERAESDTLEPWSAVGSARAQGDWYVPALSGPVYKLSRVHEDATGPLIRQVTSKTMENDGARFRISRFEAQARTGHSNLGRDASIMLEMSRDFGETWSDPKVRSLGGIGDHGQRMVWRRLGQFRQATARLSWSDVSELPVKNEVFVDVS